MDRASVCVIMPNYNYGRYIERALRALVEQSVQPQEILVFDDASTDDSVSVVEKMAERWPIIRLFRNEQNRGYLFYFERGLELTKCDYIYPASSDDQALPGFIEKSTRLLSQHPQAGLCCAYPSQYDETTGIVRDYAPDWGSVPCWFPPASLGRVLRRGAISNTTALIHRRALLEAGGFRPELRWHADWFASLVVAFRHGLCYIPERLALWTTHGVSYSSGQVRWPEQREVLRRMLRLLHSDQYRDVMPQFAASDVLVSVTKGTVIRAVPTAPGLWTPTTARLLLPGVARAVWRRARRKRRASEAAGVAERT